MIDQMRSYLLIVILLITCLKKACFSQLQANIWHFGNGRSLDFSSGTPVNTTGSQIFTTEGCASYCDKYGKLLFYTNGGGREPAFSGQDGGHIWNRNNAVLHAMDGVQGGGFSSGQSSVIFEAPGQDSVYYLFTTDELEWDIGASPAVILAQPLGRGLSYFTVDMRLNGGLGGVVLADQRVFTPTYEGLCAIRHANKRDYWIIVNQNAANLGQPSGLRIFAVTPEGVALKGSYTGAGNTTNGIIKASPDGKRVLTFVPDDATGAPQPRLLQFDNGTGTLSAPTPLPGTISSGEFSPNSRFLFTLESIPNQYELRRYDLQAANPSATATTIGNINSFLIIGPPQLGPDGNIYFLNFSQSATVTATLLNRIVCPNTLGAALQTNLQTYDRQDDNFIGLPNFSAWLFENYDSVFVSLGLDTVNLCETGGSIVLDAKNPGASYLWSNGATTQSITVNTPGTYSVTVNGACGNGTDQVVVIDCCTSSINGNITASTDSCLQSTRSFSVSGISGITSINWNFDDAGSGASNSNALNPTHRFSAPGNYVVTAIVRTACLTDTLSYPLAVVDCVKPCTGNVLRSADSCQENALSFSVQSDSLLLSVNWNFGDPSSGSANQSNLINPTHLFSAPGNYVVTAIANFRCGIDTLTKSISVSDCDTGSLGCNLFIPTAFTPNGDGLNDFFQPLAACSTELYELEVYNRWGQCVFRSLNPGNRWDGKYKGADCPIGNYVYQIRYRFAQKPQKTMAGSVRILR
jgi:gliding motility-associated-like protein